MSALRCVGTCLIVLGLGAVPAASGGGGPAPRRDAAGRAAAAPSLVGSGVSLGFPVAVVPGPDGAIYLADGGRSGISERVTSILKVDPDGSRTIVSDVHHGSGASLDSPSQRFVFGPHPLFVEPDGHLLYGLVRIDPADGDRTALAVPAAGSLSTLAVLPEAAGTILLGRESGLLRYDRGTGQVTLVSGCSGGGACVPVGSGPVPNTFDALAPASEGAVYAAAHTADRTSRILIRVDLATGDRTVLSGPGVGTGPALAFVRALLVDGAGDVLWGHEVGVVRVDPDTGDRLTVLEAAAGTPVLRTLAGMAIEPTGTLLLADLDLAAVVRVDLATGERTIVSGGPVGAGAPLCSTRGAALEATTAAVLATCDGITRVDLQTGDRTVVSDASTGGGAAWEGASDVAVEPSGALLVLSNEALMRVHPQSGDRTRLSRRRGSGLRTGLSLAVESSSSALVGDWGEEFLLPQPGLPSFNAYSSVRRLDFGTGRSALVSGGGLLSGKRGGGPSFAAGGVVGIAVESPSSLAVAASGRLLRVDLATGRRTPVGPEGTRPADVAVDGAGMWWAVVLPSAVDRYDPATGERTVISSAARGSGPQLDHPREIVLEPEGTLIVVNAPPGSAPDIVMRVDPTTGDRTVVSRP